MNNQHLDAFDGRSVVFCHQCENEWYEDNFGLECPRCHSEATEIVTAENDPRGIIPDLEDHDDPDEADIDEYADRAPNGASIYTRTYRTPSAFDRPDDPRRPVDPANGDDILSRFSEMLMGFGSPGSSQAGRSGPESLFPPAGMPAHQHPHPHADNEPFGRGPRITFTRASVTRRPDGSTSFISVSGPGPGSNRGGSPMDFDQTFEQFMAGARPPTHGQPQAGAGLPEAIHQLLQTMLGGRNGVYGDAVFSQEALDRVISDMMEANPQSNAAPPASASAIEKLERKRADAKMLGGDDEKKGGEAKGECTICISDVNIGDEVVLLPCKHWFHEECVVMWLKEHNTCPVCRTAIEDPSTPNRSGSNAGGRSGGSNSNTPRYSPSRGNPFDEHFGPNHSFGTTPPGSLQHWGNTPPDPNTRSNAFTPPTYSEPQQQRSAASGFQSQADRDRNADRLERIMRLRNEQVEQREARNVSGEGISQRRSRSPVEQQSRPWRSSLSLRGERSSGSGRDRDRDREDGGQQERRGFFGRLAGSSPWGGSSSRHSDERSRRS